MDYKAFVESGRTLLKDTKLPRKIPAKKEKVSKVEAMTGIAPGNDNPYDVFVRKAINDKLKPKEVLEKINQFIEVEEAKL